MNNNNNNELPSSAIRSVSSGGESVTVDGQVIKAEDRNARNNDKSNIACRRTRPTFGRIVFKGIY